MLVTLKQLEENLTATLTLIKSYIDARFHAQVEQNTSNVYGVATKNPE